VAFFCRGTNSTTLMTWIFDELHAFTEAHGAEKRHVLHVVDASVS
jgi:hypothetical protein